MAIEDSDREKYIERSVLVNMTLLRKTAAEKAMTGAINRVIRALTGLKGQYTKAELSKPFAIPRVTFSPDYNDPEVKKAILSQGMNSIGSLFGTPTLPQIEKISSTETGPVFNPEEFADNPAFASEQNETDIPHEKRELAKQKRNDGYNFQKISEFGSLRKSFYRARRGTNWKASVQRYGCNILRNSYQQSQKLRKHIDIRRGFIEFDLNERGKNRHITSVHITERVVQKSDNRYR